MRPTVVLVLSLATVAAAAPAPAPIAAQGIGIAPKIGTTGLGVDAAFGLGGRVVLRGGIGLVPIEYEGDFDGNDYTIELPPLFGTAGVDFYPAGPFRIMGGFLYRSADVEMTAEAEGSTEIGGQTYTETGFLIGEWRSRQVAPYAGIGFGKHTSSGLGLFLDLAVAFIGEPEIDLRAEGDLAAAPGIQSDLAAEAERIEDDFGDYASYWPILQVGLKFGLGN
jgi:hypothetical protein